MKVGRMSPEAKKRISERMKKFWRNKKKSLKASPKKLESSETEVVLESSPDIVYLLQDGTKRFAFQINGEHLVPVEIRIIDVGF